MTQLGPSWLLKNAELHAEVQAKIEDHERIIIIQSRTHEEDISGLLLPDPQDDPDYRKWLLDAKISDALKDAMADDGVPPPETPASDPNQPQTSVPVEKEKHEKYDPEQVWKAIEDICKGRG